jgi:uncharacterized protein YkwD
MKRALLSFAFLLPLAACGSDGGDASSGDAQKYMPFPLLANVYSHGEPTGKEQAELEEIQAARADPGGYIQTVIDLPSIQYDLQAYGVNKQTVLSDFAGYPPVPPLSFESHLMDSSKNHSEDMAKYDYQGHDNYDGTSVLQRITLAGYQWSVIEENVYASATSVVMCNAAFLIDWGNPMLGHRSALLDLIYPVRDIGISIVEIAPQKNSGPLVVTEDFGMPRGDSNRMLVGVVYKDADGNGRYDEGEGVGGINVVPNVGDTYAVTSQSGGYAIPLAQMTGNFQVQVQEASGVAIDQKDATMATDNVKVDFVLP